MTETSRDAYGTGNYEKCAQCMVHSGHEATAVMDTLKHPLKAFGIAVKGVRTEGDRAKEIPLDRQRPAQCIDRGIGSSTLVFRRPAATYSASVSASALAVPP